MSKNLNKWTNEDILFLKENYKVLSYSEISKVLNRSVGAVIAKASKMNLIKKDRWTEDELSFLRENYSTQTTSELANILGRTHSAVSIKAKKMGLKKYEYFYDRDFFEIIDSEEKAYWLGFVSADGWTDKHDNSYCMGIELQESDAEHLKKFNKSIHGNIEVKTRKRKGHAIVDHLVGVTESCYIKLYSKKIFHDLMTWGVHPNKSFDIEFQRNLNPGLINHYIRGYFDGNGSVWKKTSNSGRDYIAFKFTCASKSFIKELRKYLFENNIYTHEHLNKNCYDLFINSTDCNSILFLNLIYNNSSIFLDRKFQKIKNLITTTNIQTRLPHHIEICGLFNNEKENGKAEMPIRMEG